MRTDQTILTKRAANAWLEASRYLRIKVCAPYELRVGGESVDCLAFLPDFGGPKGMVIGTTLAPDFETDSDLIELAKKNGLYFSFINPAGYASYDESTFTEALIDWGFFGSLENRPNWFPV